MRCCTTHLVYAANNNNFNFTVEKKVVTGVEEKIIDDLTTSMLYLLTNALEHLHRIDKTETIEHNDSNLEDACCMLSEALTLIKQSFIRGEGMFKESGSSAQM